MEKNKETRYRYEGETLLKEVAPDKKFCFKLRLKTEDGKKKFTYEEIKIGKVWVSGGPDKFMVHIEITRGLEKSAREWQYYISEEEYKDFQMSKHDMKRLQLLTKASNGLIVVRKNVAEKFVGIRMTPDLYKELSSKAKTCNMSLSDFCREQLKGSTTHAALTEEEQKLLERLSDWRLDFLNFRNALLGVLKKIPQEERLGYMINGESAIVWRNQLKRALTFIDNFTNNKK